jgi:hypothetical protein
MLFKNLMQYNSGSETLLKKNHLTDVNKTPALNKHTQHSKIGMATPSIKLQAWQDPSRDGL